jgi:hypothetical protein
LFWNVEGRTVTVGWEVGPNKVWRFGRVFLRCPACTSRATRLYVPTSESPRAACRSCWGLTYASRQNHNYKDSGPLRSIGLTMRDLAKLETWRKQQDAREAARARWSQRRRAIRAARAWGSQGGVATAGTERVEVAAGGKKQVPPHRNAHPSPR